MLVAWLRLRGTAWRLTPRLRLFEEVGVLLLDPREDDDLRDPWPRLREDGDLRDPWPRRGEAAAAFSSRRAFGFRFGAFGFALAVAPSAAASGAATAAAAGAGAAGHGGRARESEETEEEVHGFRPPAERKLDIHYFSQCPRNFFLKTHINFFLKSEEEKFS